MVASHISRRRILRDGIALGALGLAGFPTASAFAAPAATPKLPARGNMVIRNAYVMTMEPGTPDIKDGDVTRKIGVIDLPTFYSDFGARSEGDKDYKSATRDVAKLLGELKAAGVQGDLPPWQIVRERRATFEATPEQNALRPGAVTAYKNLFLAGDWTDTGLPATIEGSVRSGDRAADLVLAMR